MIACTLEHNEVFNLPTMFNIGTLCLAAILGRILFSTSQIPGISQYELGMQSGILRCLSSGRKISGFEWVIFEKPV